MTLKIKIIFTFFLLMFVVAAVDGLIVKILRQGHQSHPTYETQNNNDEKWTASADIPLQDGVKVYYFHSNTRCANCRNIEVYAQEAVEGGFSDEIKKGKIAWQVVNYETPGNEHYVMDYQIIAPNVVLAMFKNGKQVKWTALKEVVDEASDKATFTNLLQKRLRDFIKEPDSSL